MVRGGQEMIEKSEKMFRETRRCSGRLENAGGDKEMIGKG